MAKQSPSDQKDNLDVVITGIRQDLTGIKFKMLNELLLQATNNNGKVDRDSPNFATLKSSFLNADPTDEINTGRAVISVLATEQGALSKLSKLNLDKTDPVTYEKLATEIRSVRSELNQLLSSDKGVESLLSEFLKQKSIEQLPFRVLCTEAQGMFEAGDTRPMNNAEIKVFTDQLIPHIDFKDVNITNLAKDGRIVDKGIAPILQEKMRQQFGKAIPNKPQEFTIDQKKLSPARLKEFGEQVSKSIALYSQQPALADKIFKKFEDKGIKMNQDQKDKMLQKIGPVLTSLGSEHLEKYGENIASTIVNKVYDDRSLLSRITKKFEVSSSSLDKICANIIKNDMPLSVRDSTKKLSDSMMKASMKTTDFNAKLKVFTESQGIKEDLSKKSTNELAQIRLKNAKAFDQAMFSSSTAIAAGSKGLEGLKQSSKLAQATKQLHDNNIPSSKPPAPKRSLPMLPPSKSR